MQTTRGDATLRDALVIFGSITDTTAFIFGRRDTLCQGAMVTPWGRYQNSPAATRSAAVTQTACSVSAQSTPL